MRLPNDPYGAPDRDADHGDSSNHDDHGDHGDLDDLDDLDDRDDRGMHHHDGQKHDGQKHGEGSGDRDSDAMDGAAAVGAEATVVIHATGAEVRALINGEEGTGGEADHHGPIPQSSLRRHLLRALAQTLLPNLPTIPSSSRPGAAVYRARTTTGESSEVGGTCGDSRIELRVIDQPPTSDPNRYTPSAAMDRYVRLRDRTCQFPGCNRPAEFTDLDHRVAFAAGGRTTAANLWCLCRDHHRLKHEGGWQLHPNQDGTYTWTSPTGRRYRNSTTDP